MLWPWDPLLGKNLEATNGTAAVAVQRRGKHASTTILFGKHVPAATGETGCCLRGPRRGIIKTREVGQPVQLSSAKEAEKRWRCSWVDSWQEFCTGVCDKRTRASEAEESPLLDAVTSERLVNTQQAGKGLAGSVVFCEVWRLAVAL
jgi:hypothetical protein